MKKLGSELESYKNRIGNVKKPQIYVHTIVFQKKECLGRGFFETIRSIIKYIEYNPLLRLTDFQTSKPFIDWVDQMRALDKIANRTNKVVYVMLATIFFRLKAENTLLKL